MCDSRRWNAPYDSNWPTFTEITPDEGRINGPVDVVITGTGFEVGKTKVTIAGVNCVISTMTDVEIECTVGDMSTGVYKENDKALVVITLTESGKTTGGLSFVLMRKS